MKQIAIIKRESAGTVAAVIRAPFNLSSQSELRVELNPEQSDQGKLVPQDERLAKVFNPEQFSTMTEKVITTL